MLSTSSAVFPETINSSVSFSYTAIVWFSCVILRIVLPSLRNMCFTLFFSTLVSLVYLWVFVFVGGGCVCLGLSLRV